MYQRKKRPDVVVREWTPRAGAPVFFLLELEIGLVGDARADLFQVIVATPEGLRDHATRGVIVDRAALVFSDFSWPLLDFTVGQIMQKCRGEDWRECLVKLQRYFRWEYEDYVHPDG